MKTSEILKGVLMLFSNGERWAQGYYAFNNAGSNHRFKAGETRVNSFSDRVANSHPQAACWCLMGGIYKVSRGASAVHAEDVLGRVLGTANVVRWNDEPGRKISEVRAVLKKAIALALDDEAQAA